MRMSLAVSLTVLNLALFAPLAAQAADDRPLDAAALQALAEKAQHAGLRDQCYLYARLVRDGTELADRDLADGDKAAGAMMLHSVRAYAAALDTALAKDTKKLKDAEILLRESAFHLKAAMLAASIDDRPMMADALGAIEAAQAKTMAAVFAH